MMRRPDKALRDMLAMRWNQRDERGAYAILVSAMMIMLMALAAISIDISRNVETRQRLKDTVDAAAHAGAYELPGNAANLTATVRRVARAQDPAANPQVDAWCIVGSSGTTKQVNVAHIPSTCYPGPAPYTVSNYPGLACDATICAIPCRVGTTTKCNTVRVEDRRDVDYTFARAIGFDKGSTGSVVTVACKGACGAETPNPLDVVIMADRTASMSNDNRKLMVEAIESTLLTMDKQLHYVSLGTLHKSIGSAGCPTTPRANPSSSVSDSTRRAYAAEGNFIATRFSNNYVTTGAGGAKTLNAGDDVVKGLACMKPDESRYGDENRGMSGSYYGTWLAASMKAGVRQLLKPGTMNNLTSLPARPGTPRKVLIFETDGQPWEIGAGTNNGIGTTGSTNIDVEGDVMAGYQSKGTRNGQEGCSNLVNVARQAKEAGVTVITIGFGLARSANCSDGSTSGTYTRDALAASASNHPNGSASTASTCSTAAQITAENTDGDFYFCAAGGSELADIFKTAMAQVGEGIKLLRLPKG